MVGRARGWLGAASRGDLRVHRVERAAVEQHEAADRQSGEIDQQIDAFGRGDEDLRHRDGSLEQAAVGADEQERQRTAAIAGESQPENARVRTVEHAQTIAAGGDVAKRARREIDQRFVAVPSMQQVGRGGLYGSAAPRAAIGQEQRDLRFAGHECQRTPQREFVVVLDHEQPQQVRGAPGRR